MATDRTTETTTAPQADITAPHVYVAINAVMGAIGKVGIAKSRNNQQQGYKFRGIDDVYNELNSLLAEHKLLMLPVKMTPEHTERQTKNGGVIFYARVTVDFKLVSAKDGSSEMVQTLGEAMDSADKSSNKAQSAAYKYAAIQVFCIPTEGDNDADAVTHEVAPKAVERGARTASAAVQAAGVAINLCNSVEALTKWASENESMINALSNDDIKAVKDHYRVRLARMKEHGPEREIFS